MKTYLVYMITCTTTGKYYVGYTKDFPTRWKTHLESARYGADWYFSNAIRLYGEQGFKHEFLSTNLTKKEALELEKLWIIVLGSHWSTGRGYNMTWGGEGDVISSLSLEKKKEMYKKVSEALTGVSVPSRGRKGHKFGYQKGAVPLVTGKTHVEFYGEEKAKEVAAKLRKANLGSKKGFWVTNGVQNKVVKNESLIPEGWWRGRHQKDYVRTAPVKLSTILKRSESLKATWARKRAQINPPVPVAGDSTQNLKI